MIYDISQVTSYRYGAPVPNSRHVLRMTPRARAGQRLIDFSLEVDPEPTARAEHDDFFGNRTIFVALDAPHDSFIVRTHARVAVDPVPSLHPADTGAFEAIREAAAASSDLAPASPAHMLFPSRSVPLSPEIRDYAATSFPARRPVLEGALEIARRIAADFTYEIGATDASTAPATAFSMRRGVCQDFAHVMIAGLRGLGLPAAYVSGYLRTRPPPGRPRLVGADATHAWVAVWCGPDGWRGVDPTNAMLVGQEHVVVAVGRDYADVSPIDGVLVGSGDQRLEVGVDVAPVEESARG